MTVNRKELAISSRAQCSCGEVEEYIEHKYAIGYTYVHTYMRSGGDFSLLPAPFGRMNDFFLILFSFFCLLQKSTMGTMEVPYTGLQYSFINGTCLSPPTVMLSFLLHTHFLLLHLLLVLHCNSRYIYLYSPGRNFHPS